MPKKEKKRLGKIIKKKVWTNLEPLEGLKGEGFETKSVWGEKGTIGGQRGFLKLKTFDKKKAEQ